VETGLRRELRGIQPIGREKHRRPMSETTDFGYRKVALGDKQELVDDVFHSVARRYDLMNDLMSAGMHRVWKDAMVTALNPPKDRRWHSLDVAGGTGDIAFRIVEASRGNAEVTVLDINGSMLQVGRERAEKRGLAQNLSFVEANAEDLPFEDNSFDAYTIAFGIRNVPRIDAALGEAWRVLKPGGRFLCLEFSQVDVPGLDKIYDLYSFNMIPAIGRAVTGDAEAYRYLVESIRKFPDQETFLGMVKKAGFGNAAYRNLSLGIACLHSGWKI